MKNSQHIIKELLEESNQFNSNDPLVNISLNNTSCICVDYNYSQIPLLKEDLKLLRITQRTHRETGINALAGCSIFWINGEGINKTTTPLILQSISYKIDKLNQTICFKPFDEPFINPFVIITLKRDFDIDLNSTPVNKVVEKMISLGLRITETDQIYISNFHHHRFQVLKELEEITGLETLSETIISLLEGNNSYNLNEDTLTPKLLFPADTDHHNVFKAFKDDHLVIQGPPGTGKSQVLTNLVAKLIFSNKNIVVVSEKRAALEVIQNKLRQFQLDNFCFIADKDYLSHSLLMELKECWDFLESLPLNTISNLDLTTNYIDNLQSTINLLREEQLIGGISFYDFKLKSKNISLEEEYQSDVPSILNYLENEATIELIFSQNLNRSIGSIKKVIIEQENFISFDKKIRNWINSIQKLTAIFDLKTMDDLSLIVKKAIRYQLFENDFVKKFNAIFVPDSKAQKRFLALRKKHQKLNEKLAKIVTSEFNWKLKPSEVEVEYFLSKFKEKKSLFASINRNRKWRLYSLIPLKESIEALNQRKQELEILNKLSQIKIDFCELGVTNDEIESIFQTLNSNSENEWRELFQVPIEEINAITNHHDSLRELKNDLKTHFQFSGSVNIQQALSEMLNTFKEILVLKPELIKIEADGLSLLLNSSSKTNYESIIFSTHWVIFKTQFPHFSTFNISDLSKKVDSITDIQKSESILFSEEIKQSIFRTFKAYHELLNTPAKKLNANQKEFKQELKKGKAILVKEFSKTRSHPTLRELYNSPARIWIQLLKPIWLSNPVQIGKCFPMSEKLFNVAIFDEASQIPLANALGTIQRSSHVIVAGDEHQMGPQSYFKKGGDEQMDLLHQASYYWKKTPLTHHYRSEHPKLITFSNRQFYKNKLQAFPSIDKTDPIKHHFIQNGCFQDRKNPIEAKAIADYLESIIHLKDSIGIVAFSEEQLNCIWEQLSSKIKPIIETRMDDKTLFFKALENVQGDECDILIISFGYGRDGDGNFAHRFGPVNGKNGRKRLNVLFTRAIKSIDFFSSIQSDDFKLSKNEAVNLLHKWFLFVENSTPSNEADFPFELNPKSKDNTLIFENVTKTLSHAQELVTLHSVLRKRGWSIEFQ